MLAKRKLPRLHLRLQRCIYSEITLPSSQDQQSSSSSTAPSSDNDNTSIALSNHPRANAYNNDPPRSTNLPTPPQTTHPRPSPPYSSMNPPFHTHVFFAALEKSFPTTVARTLMRATRALLMDKVARARRDGLGKKDLENQAYLFRAALSELRNDTAMRIRNDTASIHSTTAAIRRDVENLSAHMKEAMANLRHENQMEVDNRKTEARTDLKKQALAIENVASKAMIKLGSLRTEVERMRWINMSRSLMSLATFALMVVAFMEITRKPPEPAQKSPPPPLPPIPDLKRPEGENLEDSNYVT